MPLSDTVVHYVKTRDKSYRIADGKGVYLEVTPIVVYANLGTTSD
jgi:hypothetical protein